MPETLTNIETLSAQSAGSRLGAVPPVERAVERAARHAEQLAVERAHPLVQRADLVLQEGVQRDDEVLHLGDQLPPGQHTAGLRISEF